LTESARGWIPCTLRQVIVKLTNACDTGLLLSIAKQAITPKQQAVPFNLASHAHWRTFTRK